MTIEAKSGRDVRGGFLLASSYLEAGFWSMMRRFFGAGQGTRTKRQAIVEGWAFEAQRAAPLHVGRWRE
jgi:hypothetical protein